jgi:mono/diheme cytochrome c family protein
MTASRAPHPRSRRDRRRTVRLGLVAVAALAALALLPGLARAQTSGDAANGRNLYLNMAQVTGLNLSNCSACHTAGGVGELRQEKFAQASPYGDVSFDEALPVLQAAIARQAMRQYRVLTSQQVADIAAYIADVPRFGAEALSFSASATGQGLVQTVTLTHARSAQAGESLRVTGTSFGSLVSGTTNPFRISRNACQVPGQTLGANGSCQIDITYTGTLEFSEVPLLVTMQVGSDAPFARAVTLRGSIAGATPPPPGGSPPAADAGGGGALGAGWLLALAAAAGALSRRRR